MTDRATLQASLSARGVAPSRLDDLEAGIAYALNGPYYAIQVAIGQHDGGIASIHASGRDEELAAALAAKVVAAGWDGASVPTWVTADTGTLLPDGGTVPDGDHGKAQVEKAADDFLVSVARQAGTPPYETFRMWDRDDVVAYFQEYLETEAAYENPAP